MISFQRQTDREGWRYSVAWRTRRAPEVPGAPSAWDLQRWNGGGWEHICYVRTYAAARYFATKWDAERAVA